jgi:NADH pyrophosphatase NudC (nudix superfamily)
LTNLHWVVQENYDTRMESDNPSVLHKTKLWPLGCEQHVSFIFLVEATAGVEITPGPGESQEVSWFSPDEVRALDAAEIYSDSREELLHVFSLAQIT